jgi:hypothetical protein
MPRANPHFSTRSRLAIAEDWFKTFKPFNRFARFNAFGRSKFKVQEFKSKLELGVNPIYWTVGRLKLECRSGNFCVNDFLGRLSCFSAPTGL